MLDPSRLHVRFTDGAQPSGPVVPRRYTFTHSDRTGDLFLGIGTEYDREALDALQVRVERDEVLGEWALVEAGPRLDLRMAAQGGVPVFGTGTVRRRIFCRYRSLVLAALRHGERKFTEAHPELSEAPVVAHFEWRDGRDDHELWGRWGDA